MSTLSRLTLAASIFSLLLAGCADHPATKARTSSTTTTSARAASPDAGDTTHRERAGTSSANDSATAATSATDNTGIAACDDYLSSYLACHRAAKIYAPDQLQSRYQAMRTSLLRDSQNPDIRPQLGARCNSLASQLRQALHGKSCASSPADSSSTP
ncbi:MAG: hypothetical protein ABI767_06355 [Rhodanobacter sp.]